MTRACIVKASFLVRAGKEFTSATCQRHPILLVYSPSCRQGLFSETPIHPLGCLYVRTGAMGRFLSRGEISTRYLATPLDGYSFLEPTPPAQLLQHMIRVVGCRQSALWVISRRL